MQNLIGTLYLLFCDVFKLAKVQYFFFLIFQELNNQLQSRNALLYSLTFHFINFPLISDVFQTFISFNRLVSVQYQHMQVNHLPLSLQKVIIPRIFYTFSLCANLREKKIPEENKDTQMSRFLLTFLLKAHFREVISTVKKGMPHI